MLEVKAMLFLYAESPLHPGSGSELGPVDLPIQREKHTGLPMIQASGLKGVLRDEAESAGMDEDKLIKWLFGPKNGAEHAGALSISDARLLLFPLRSLKGIFVWATCPLILYRLKRDLAVAGIGADFEVPVPADDNKALATENGLAKLAVGQKVVLEEYAFSAQQSTDVGKLSDWLKTNAFPQGEEYKPWRDWLPEKLVVLPDDPFVEFTHYHTQVATRTRLNDDTKTVATGALWSEEHLPPETLLYAPIFASRPRSIDSKVPDDLKTPQQVMKALLKPARDKGWNRIQLGGDATVGRGIAMVRFLPEEVK